MCFDYPTDAGARAVEDHLRARYGERFARLETPAYTFVHQPRFALPGRPLVSIIIPTRDRIDLLAPCIESILGRSTWANFEVIVIDNGSAHRGQRSVDRLQGGDHLVRAVLLAGEDEVAVACHDLVLADPPYVMTNYDSLANYLHRVLADDGLQKVLQVGRRLLRESWLAHVSTA